MGKNRIILPDDIISIKWFLLHGQLDCMGIKCAECIYKNGRLGFDPCITINIKNRRYRDAAIRRKTKTI
jgi:hypothetical protein